MEGEKSHWAYRGGYIRLELAVFVSGSPNFFGLIFRMELKAVGPMKLTGKNMPLNRLEIIFKN